jgi:hypothetical protein
MHAARPAVHRRSTRQALVAPRSSVSNDSEAEPEVLSSVSVLPLQFFGSQINLYPKHPEAALMRAVLEDALSCFQRGLASEKRRAQRLGREAEEWFFRNDFHWPFSFVSICAVLGLEPEYIRRGLKRFSQCQPDTSRKKCRHLTRVQPRLAA